MRESDTLIVVSDHGFSKLKNMVHLVNFFLKEGYMTIKGDDKIRKGINIQLIKNIIMRLGGVKFLEVLKRNSKLRNSIIDFLPVGKYSYLRSIDWHNSLLSYAEGTGGIVHLNPELKKDQKKLDAFFAELRKRALEIRDNEGNQVIEDVYQGETFYSSDLVDIIFNVKKGYCIDGYDAYDNSIFGKSKSGYIGMHDEDGIIIMFSKRVKNSYRLTPSSVLDVLPTVFYFLNLKIPEYLDGRIIKDAFFEDIRYELIKCKKDIFMRKERLRFKPSKDDEEAVKDKLENLGYL
jgi:predicted AlkP superfamily phosphohydrolase/phosphomutase